MRVEQQLQAGAVHQRDALQVEHHARLAALEAILEHGGQLGDVLAADPVAAADDVDGSLSFLFEHGRER